ncbi:MAG: type II toxin-antitoxin system PemK/MazF family toxin [Planctomycetota bacterium]
MQRLSQGQVVQVAVTDPRGLNLKPRPAVILTATDELSDADEFVVAAISTNFDEPLPMDHILLPWSRHGRARSGLTEPSVVKCRWLRRIKREDVLNILGHLPSTTMRDVLRVVTQS